MQKRNLSQLAIYEIQESVEILPIQCLKNLYLEKTSEVVYITKDGILYGIVSIEDLFRIKSGITSVNKDYTVLEGFDVIKAHEIFRTKRNIHKIPVVNEAGQLLGDYSRWDDELYIQRCRDQILLRHDIRKKLESFEAVYIVEPTKEKQSHYKWMSCYLNDNKIHFKPLTKECIIYKILENSLFIFVDEDEKRGSKCLYKIENISDFNREYIGLLERNFITYKDFISEIMRETDFEKYKISNVSQNNEDEKATALLSELEKKGIKCLCLYINEDELTDYGNIFYANICGRINNKNEKINKKEFYSELNNIEDYIKEKAQQEIEEGVFSFEYKKNLTGKYFNTKDGRRVTCFQPETYLGKIYLFGPCTIIGGYVEDQYTIASYLQESLLEKGYAYRVENYGSQLRYDSSIDARLCEIDKYCKNDIVIYLSRVGKAVGIQGKSLEKIFEEHQIPNEWVIDDYTHCNHKANRIIAGSIMKMVESYLNRSKKEFIKIDLGKTMGNYVFKKYIETKRELYDIKEGVVGSIVMNCNPFTKGHRYLIEEARKIVDLLIVFVVEENISLFTFEERYWLVKEGTKDLDNVIVVPSGEFILSENNFNEYFKKKDDEVAVLNAEYDIKVFADYIAKPLDISYRFAGEEPNDHLTNLYNKAMKKILTEKGIQFIEFSRSKVNSEVVSASSVRKYLEQKAYMKVFDLVPETTKVYLKQQCGLS